jgi:predicted ATPase
MTSLDATHFLLDAKLLKERVPSFDAYPFSLPAVRHLGTLTFHPKVTFIIGENGSGKSTLLEAIATAWGFNPEGGSKNFNFHTRDTHSSLHAALRLGRGVKRARDGFFLRAESFYNVATEIDVLDEDPAGGPPILPAYGGVSLHKQSHGESFFALMVKRFRGNGLYILDEPEAALSPTRQLAMLARIHQLVGLGGQFIIATHSPILMAYPDAALYQIGETGIVPTAYEDTEHVLVTRAFLGNPQKHLEALFESP